MVVTGATGNIGTALLRRLHEAGDWSVTGIARRLPIASSVPYGYADWLACDVGADGAVDRLATVMVGAAAVVHLAWAVNPVSSDPPMRRTNRTGTDNVLRAAADAGVGHVVCASSAAAYTPADPWRPVTEDWPLGGVAGSAYSQGKAELERTLDRFVVDHPDTAVARIRPCTVVSRDAGGEFARWLVSPLLPTSALASSWLPLPFWRSLRGQFVHAGDVAEALRLILADRARGPFNLAGDSRLDAARLAGTLGGRLVPVPGTPLRLAAWCTWRLGVQPVHPGWLRLADRAPLVDTARARRLGWQPRYDSTAALADLVTGLRDGAGTASPALSPRTTTGVRWGRPSHQAQ